MSKEIVFQSTLSVKNGNLNRTFQLGQQQITQTVGAISDQTQTIPTSWTQISISAEIATLGVALFRNLDVANYIQLGILASTGVVKPWGRLKAGESFPFRLEPGIAYYAKANTASIKLQTAALND